MGSSSKCRPISIRMFPFWKLIFYSGQPVGSLEHPVEAFGCSLVGLGEPGASMFQKEEVSTSQSQPGP